MLVMFLNYLCRKPKQTAIISFMQCEMLLIDVTCCVVVLQNCRCFVEGGTGSCIDTCVMCDVDGTEEVSIKVEEAIDTMDEIPEAISFPPIKNEHEVRLWGVCEVVAAHAFRLFIASKRKM